MLLAGAPQLACGRKGILKKEQRTAHQTSTHNTFQPQPNGHNERINNKMY